MLNRIVVVLTVVVIVLISCKKEVKKPDVKEIPPIIEYGYNLNNYTVIRDTVRKNETFGTILSRYNILANRVHQITETAKDSFDFGLLKAGKPYTILAKKDTAQTAQVFIYVPDIIGYSVIDFQDSLVNVTNFRKPIKTRRRVASGVLSASLFTILKAQQINDELAIELADIYKWSINFYKIQPDDKFKIIFDERYIDDSVSVGINKIYASYFEHKNKPFYAFGYVLDSTKSNKMQFFDETGRELRKMFLKSPLKFGRISSKYSMSRYVHIYGRHKPHLGTDFAAPIGTPILSTASGVVEEAGFKRGNGNYVKVKHNKAYATQYLHMSRIAVKKGQRVDQGQVIGYIGMTGSTTGPHVCYRFWKNGKQVDAMKQGDVLSDPLPSSIKNKYLDYIKPLKAELDSIVYFVPKEKIIENDTLE